MLGAYIKENFSKRNLTIKIPKDDCSSAKPTISSKRKLSNSLAENLGPKAKKTKIVSKAKKTKIVSKAKKTKVVSKAKKTKIVSKAKKTKAGSKAKKTKVVSKAKKTKAGSKAKKTKVVSKAKAVSKAKKTKKVVSTSENPIANFENMDVKVSCDKDMRVKIVFKPKKDSSSSASSSSSSISFPKEDIPPSIDEEDIKDFDIFSQGSIPTIFDEYDPYQPKKILESFYDIAVRTGAHALIVQNDFGIGAGFFGKVNNYISETKFTCPNMSCKNKFQKLKEDQNCCFECTILNCNYKKLVHAFYRLFSIYKNIKDPIDKSYVYQCIEQLGLFRSYEHIVKKNPGIDFQDIFVHMPFTINITPIYFYNLVAFINAVKEYCRRPIAPECNYFSPKEVDYICDVFLKE